MKSAVLLFFSLSAFGQTPPDAPLPGSVSGTVLDAGTGTPLPGAAVFFNQGSRNQIKVEADSQGVYELRGLPAGSQRITARIPVDGRPFGPYKTRSVIVVPGQTTTGIDFRIRMAATVSGRILDENKEPMPGVSVLLIAREYKFGEIYYVYAAASSTNDLGEYTVRADAGRGYLVMAQRRRFRIPAIADTPGDPKFRRLVPATTYYPSSPDISGAQPVTMRPGEVREAVDIQMPRVPGYCAAGVLELNGRPSDLQFTIAEARPTSGASGDGAMFMSSMYSTTGPDGKFRVCDLQPGQYTMTASPTGSEPTFFSAVDFSITDHDLETMKVAPVGKLAVPGEVVLEGKTEAQPSTTQNSAKLNLLLSPLTRAPFRSEMDAASARPAIPGEFIFDGILMDDYSLRVTGMPKDNYLRDITYNGRSILYDRLRPGSAAGGAGIRVILAAGGGKISAKVADANGTPVPEVWVYVLPGEVSSEGMLAAAFVSGEADQNGSWTSNSLAPGKYFVVALQDSLYKSPEDMTKLWQLRSKGQEVELGAGQTASVTLAVSR